MLHKRYNMDMARSDGIRRIDLSLPKRFVAFIEILAEQDNVPLTTKTAELVKRGLQSVEDSFFVEQAEERLREIDEGSVRPLSSEQFWSDVEEERGESLAL